MKTFKELGGFKVGDAVSVDTQSITHGIVQDTIVALFIQDDQVWLGIPPYPAAILNTLSWSALSNCTRVKGDA